MNDSPALSTLDRTRRWWAGSRYDFWLDVYCVPREQRRALRTELKSNLTDAARDVGFRSALAKLGSLRHLAADTSRDGELRSRWTAGMVAAASVFAVSVVVFFFMTMYYAEGVLDANATEPVTSSLFPYPWSSITVDPSSGLEFTLQTGPSPLVLAIVAWLLVAAPWRVLRQNQGAGSEAHAL